MQLLLSHMFLSFMVRTSPLNMCSQTTDSYMYMYVLDSLSSYTAGDADLCTMKVESEMGMLHRLFNGWWVLSSWPWPKFSGPKKFWTDQPTPRPALFHLGDWEQKIFLVRPYEEYLEHLKFISSMTTKMASQYMPPIASRSRWHRSRKTKVVVTASNSCPSCRWGRRYTGWEVSGALSDQVAWKATIGSNSPWLAWTLAR